MVCALVLSFFQVYTSVWTVKSSLIIAMWISVILAPLITLLYCVSLQVYNCKSNVIHAGGVNLISCSWRRRPWVPEWTGPVVVGRCGLCTPGLWGPASTGGRGTVVQLHYAGSFWLPPSESMEVTNVYSLWTCANYPTATPGEILMALYDTNSCICS